MTSRAQALSEIMKIETKLKQLNTDSKYRRLQQIVRDLKNPRSHTFIQIKDPETGKTNIKLRKNSTKAKKYLQIYEHQLQEYQTQVQELNKRKNTLKTQLFS